MSMAANTIMTVAVVGARFGLCSYQPALPYPESLTEIVRFGPGDRYFAYMTGPLTALTPEDGSLGLSASI